MGCGSPCPACNGWAFWSYASPHACGEMKDDEDNAILPLKSADDEREQPSADAAGRQ